MSPDRGSGRGRLSVPGSRWLALGLVLAAIGLGSLLLSQVEKSVFGRVPILDEVYYLDRAAEISGGSLLPAEPFFMSPLYPLLVAVAGAGGGVPVDRVFEGPELRGLRLLQLGFWLGTLVLIRLLAGQAVPDHWHGRRQAWARWLPVVLFALYRPALVYAMAVLLESSLVFFLVFSLYLTIRIGSRGTAWWWPPALGVVLGLAGLLRGTTLLLLPVMLGFLWRVRAADRLRNSGLMLAGVLVVLAGPVLHNSRLAGRITGPTLNGGVNLYIGNGPEANGFYVAAVPGDWREDPAGRSFLAGRFGLPEVSLAAADRMWAAEAWSGIRHDPLRAIRLVGRKIWLQLQGWEIDQLMPLGGWTRAVPLLRGLITPYALLVVLGLAGISAWRDSRVVVLLLTALAVLLLGQSLFFVVSRYRLVLAPLWAVLAGVGAVRLFARRRGAWLLAILAMVLVVPWGLNEVRTSWAALAEANEALRWSDIGRADGSPAALRRAEDLYRRSLAVESTPVASWLGLGAVLGALDRPDSAMAVLREGLASVPDQIPLKKAIFACELERGPSTEALRLGQEILRDRPEDAATLHNVSVLLAGSGQADEALRLARRLLDAHPDDPHGYVDVGVLLARSGRRAEARAVFAAGLQRCPDSFDLQRNLALVSDQQHDDRVPRKNSAGSATPLR